MSLVIEATFQDGAFKPDELIPFLSGQRVKLMIELLPQEAARESLFFPAANPTVPIAASDLRTEHEKLHPFLFDPQLAAYRAGLVKQMEPPLDQAMESIGVPAVVWRWIVNNFRGLRERVLDTEPATPANKFQRFTRKALTTFGNVSSLLIYLVLVLLLVKLLFLWLQPQTSVMDTLAHLVAGNIAAFSLLVLAALLFMRGLFAISDFVKSYRVMTIIGVFAAIKALAKTSFLLLTATTVRGMWGTLWQFFSGALK